MEGEPSQHIVIVEDEPKLAQLLREYLAQAGYVTHCLSNGLEVVPWVTRHRPQLVLLDLMLPGKDGLAICRELRAFSQVPIIIVTARVEEIDRLLGLEFGADDYICKPFSPREVVARVKAVLRRLQSPAGSATQYGGLTLDAQQYLARLDGQPLELTPAEFRLLRTFMAHPGRVFSRNQLVEALYDDFRAVSDRTVDSHIKNLRKKLHALRPDQDVIHSVYGVGYKLDL
ncbi:MAG: response regulator [Candidatus Tectimicrobiota bacterium]